MLRTLKFTTALLAGIALGATAASAQVVQEVYTAPAPQVIYTGPAPVYVTPTPRVVTQVVPRTVVVPQTYVPQTVVNQPYVVPQGETYVVPQVTTTQVIYRPANCGTYHFWDGTACVDARNRPAFEINY